MKRYFLMVMIWAVFSGNHLWAQPNEEESIFIYQDHGKKDPFWPLVNSTGNIINYDFELSVMDMVLEGIMSDKNGVVVAIVNGRLIKKGDRLGEFIVDSIEKNSVFFSKGEEKFELKLKKKEE